MSGLNIKYALLCGFLIAWQAFPVIKECSEVIINNNEKALTLWDSTEFVKIDNTEELPEQISIDTFDKEYEKQDFFEDKRKTGLFFRFKSTLIKKVYEKYFTEKGYLRTLHRFIPYDLNSKHDNKIGFFIVHGTYASNNNEYYDDQNATYQSFLEYAAYLARKYKKIVDVYSFAWNGKNSDKDRDDASLVLAGILNLIKTHYSFFASGHSNGANLLYKTANNLVGARFEEVIAIAPPTFEKKHYSYAIHNINYPFVILSRADWIRLFAHLYTSYTGDTCDKYNFCRKREQEKPFDDDEYTYVPCENGVTHVWVTDNNAPPSHCGLAALFVPTMPDVMEILYEKFIYDTNNHAIIQNIALNIIPKERSTEENYSLSLYPRNKKEELAYQKLPKELQDLSEQNKKKHKEIYGTNKNEMGMFYKFYKGFTNVLKDIW